MADSPLWRFSLRFYALPDVAPACVRLQDESGADVNLLLFLLFLADQQQRALTKDEIASVDRTIAAWRDEVVKPLRSLRRRLKPGIAEVLLEQSEGVRLSVKKLELESERIEQSLLERYVSAAIGQKVQSREAAAKQSLAAYASLLGGFPDRPLAIINDAFASS